MIWIAATIVHFSDGGESEITVLHTGTERDCQFVSDNTHAVAYSGPRPVANAQAFVMRIEPKDQGETAA